MNTILVTGGAGFIGCNFIRMMLRTYPELKIVNVDLLTYAGRPENMADFIHDPRHVFIKADICDKAAIKGVFERFSIDAVVNFAAESHVDRSIDEPSVFLTTNVIGTQVLLDVAKHSWKDRPYDKHCRGYKPGVKFLQISTDEVYGSLGQTSKFTEATPLQPNSPYSASKAGADMLVRAYYETYGMPVIITRCSNNYGPYQFPEKLIPLIINNCLHERELPIYGDGLQVRDWLHVSDHCAAIAMVLHKGICGEVYNIGGNNEKANIQIVNLIIEALGKSQNLIKHVEDRPGHDRRYAIDNTKVTSQLGWYPAYSFEQGIRETIQWYIDNLTICSVT
jgi:dTDP-glucose 4,6-dehydratase